mgnify:CR=1 FL=1
MNNCRLCPFECEVDREKIFGRCNASTFIHIVRARPHFGEEPCISGERGSGTIFFSGCALRCVYCQNYKISREEKGKEFSAEEFAKFLIVYAKSGVHNINLVTPSHYADKITQALILSRDKIDIPIIWNSSGYEKTETLKKLSGLIDIYLMDSKYYSPEVSERYSGTRDYFEINLKALSEIFLQQPKNIYDNNGLLVRGVIVRHLILPSNTFDSRCILRNLKKNFSENITLSLMCQYTPLGDARFFPEINRRLKRKEFNIVYDTLVSLGYKNGYIQSFSSADDSYVPDFDIIDIYGIGNN